MAKKEAYAHAAELALYEKLVATQPGLERKGAMVPYTSINGNMFSYLTKEGTLALRLPADAREAFLAKYKTKLVEAYGIVQKEYVAVPASLLAKTAEIEKHLAASYAYASSLKPKATTRPKPAAKKTTKTTSKKRPPRER